MSHLAFPRSRRSRWPRPGAALVAVAAAVTLVLTTAGPAGATPAAGAAGQPATTGPDRPGPLPDLDTRQAEPDVAPSAAQRELVADLDATVRWTPFGTAQSLIRYGDMLATGVPGADPVAAARTWLSDNRALYRIDPARDLVVHAEVPIGADAYAVVFQQRVGGLPVSPDGFASVGVTGSTGDGWSVAYASGTLVPHDALTGTVRMTSRDGLVAAADDAGVEIEVADTSVASVRSGWLALAAEGIAAEQLVRPVAFATPDEGLRPAYEVFYYDGAADGYRSIVDAETGEVRFRESIVHDAVEEPMWSVYPSYPPMSGVARPPWNYPGADTRDTWCWTDSPGCDLAVANDASPVPWDVDPRTGEPTFTTIGNAVDAAEWWDTSAGPGHRPVSPDRDYRFDWTNVWHGTDCRPANLAPGGNDIDAAVTNLFAMNWRVHDYTYHLGFNEENWNAQDFNFGTNPDGEGDPVIARAQSGAISPGSRSNATMATRPDGTSSIMSMFLWQPTANDFYVPCVPGDFDMTVIGHEYGHMVENRLIGKGVGRSGFHAGMMGESWGDLLAVAYLNDTGLVTGSEVDRFAVGRYVTGGNPRGIRNHNMAWPSVGQFPRPGRDPMTNTLHFGAMGYDLVGPQVHADSQIWSATNYDLRSLFLDRYPSRGVPHERECAAGLHDAADCAGNRRWVQIMFDAMILMPAAPTMLDARDAYFAADLMRFGGANQDLLWEGFARRGFGVGASVEGTSDTDPVPSFASPAHDNATLRFEAVAKDEAGQPVDADVFVGTFEARTTPLRDVEEFLPHPRGYMFTARAEGYGHVRFRVRNLRPGEDRTIRIHFPTNLASTHQGAAASGDGIRHGALIDDTEGTNWQSTGLFPQTLEVAPPSPAAGSYGAAGADFGPVPPEDGITGELALVNDGSDAPTEGCQPLVGFPAGAVALIDRGNCAFVTKARNAQAAGATGVVVANNQPGDPFGMGGNAPDVTIPSIMISMADGATVKAGLPATGTVASVATIPAGDNQVTVALADSGGRFRLARVSAQLLPGQNRLTALRQFELHACTAGSAANPTCDGTIDAGWQRIHRSHPDAFPGPNFRPTAPDLALRTFQVPTTDATHVRLVVVTNQCTGHPGFQGDQVDPSLPSTDCRLRSVGSDEVRAAALQLLTSRPRVDGATLVD